jgi:hypothetical protein
VPLTMSQASIPTFTRILNSLSAILDKGAAHAKSSGGDAAALLQARLAPDMFPLVRQVQIATDHAKGAAARLSGREPPKYEDNEASFEELKARIAKALDFVKGVPTAEIDGSEEKPITLTVGGNPMTFTGRVYLLHFALPNFYFHVTTAYDILRHNGVPLGKRDFIGSA